MATELLVATGTEELDSFAAQFSLSTKPPVAHYRQEVSSAGIEPPDIRRATIYAISPYLCVLSCFPGDTRERRGWCCFYTKRACPVMQFELAASGLVALDCAYKGDRSRAGVILDISRRRPRSQFSRSALNNYFRWDILGGSDS
jgi:hypothetical protein